MVVIEPKEEGAQLLTTEVVEGNWSVSIEENDEREVELSWCIGIAWAEVVFVFKGENSGS